MDDYSTPPPSNSSAAIPLHLIYFDDAKINIALSCFTFVAGVLTLLMNCFIYMFYVNRSRSALFDKLFMFLAAVDGVTGISAILQSFTLLTILLNQDAALSVLLPITYFFSAVSFHVSVFYNVLLAVSRTISLVSPFFRLHAVAIYIVAMLYPLLWAGLAIYEIISVLDNYSARVDHINYLLISPLCGSELIYNFNEDFPSSLYYILLLGIPYVIPSLVCSVCCITTFVSMREHAGLVGDGAAGDRSKRRATITVFQLSIVFFICNTLFFITELTLQLLDPDQVVPLEMYIVYSSANLLPFLNSLINPIILIYRGSNLQVYIKRSVSLQSYTRRPTKNDSRAGSMVGSHLQFRATSM